MTNASMWKVMGASFFVTLALLFLAHSTIFAGKPVDPDGKAPQSLPLPRAVIGS